jgi:hypothetical protein
LLRFKTFTKNNYTILLTALFILATGNFALFARLLEIYPPTGGNVHRHTPWGGYNKPEERIS